MNPEYIESLGWVLSGLVIAIVILLILRQLVLWYFRINQIANDIAYIANYYRVLDRQAAHEREVQSKSKTPSANRIANP